MSGFQLLNIIPRASLVSGVILGFVYIAFSPNTKSAGDYSALKLHPADTNLRVLYVQDLLERGRWEEANNELNTGYDFDKKNVYLNGLLNRFVVSSGEIRQEIAKTLEVVNKRPDYGAGWARLASFYETIGQQEQADLARSRARELGY